MISHKTADLVYFAAEDWIQTGTCLVPCCVTLFNVLLTSGCHLGSRKNCQLIRLSCIFHFLHIFRRVKNGICGKQLLAFACLFLCLIACNPCSFYPTDFLEILYLDFLLRYVHTLQFWWKSDKNYTFTWRRTYVCNISRLLVCVIETVCVQAEAEETFDWTYTHTRNSVMDSKSLRLWDADYDWL